MSNKEVFCEYYPRSCRQLSSEEYWGAYDIVKKASNVVINKINNLDDLNQYFSPVGEAVSALVQCSIQAINQNYGWKHRPESYCWNPESRLQIIDRDTDTATIVDVYDNHVVFNINSISTVPIIHRYQINLLRGNKNFVSNGGLQDVISNYAFDYCNRIFYYPCKLQYDKETQQGFARIVQKGLNTLLSVYPDSLGSRGIITWASGELSKLPLIRDIINRLGNNGRR